MVPYSALLLVFCASLQYTVATDGEPPNKKPKIQPPDCKLNWNPASPIILYDSPKGTPKGIILPEKEGNAKILKIQFGKKVTISCSRGSFTKANLPKTGILAECQANGELVYQTTALSTKDIECSLTRIGSSEYYIKESVKDLKRTCASKKGKMIGIGFETYGNYFHPQIEVCFDTQYENTLWTEHTLHGKNYPARTRDRSGHWSPDSFFTSRMNDIYYTEHQQDLFKAQLGQTVNAPGKYIARGHMSPNADFVTPAERKATFHYINALPQWQAGNNGNWKSIEKSVQNMAESSGHDIKIISGGHGILELKNTNNKDVSIYLGNYNNGGDKVPVPNLTWKIVIDEAKGQGVAFIVLNNPLLITAPTSNFCNVIHNKKDICGQLTWLTKNFHDQRGKTERGYAYCCTVSDFVTKLNTKTGFVVLPQPKLVALLE